jgi:putative toxin-antitoxin system antitoxin component (TIGR02293 family)
MQGGKGRRERLARIAALAEQVWEDDDLAHRFLTTPQPQLDGERPVDLTRSELGSRQVEMLLMKLEYALPV